MKLRFEPLKIAYPKLNVSFNFPKVEKNVAGHRKREKKIVLGTM